MKQLVKIFCLVFLFSANNSIGQKDKMFSNLEEALQVNPDSVYRLDLSKQKLDKVPEELVKFKNLQQLDLSKNKLTELPNSFYFEDLRIIDLTKNKFEVFPAQLLNIKSIRNLFLGKNDIEIIPDKIGEMLNLIVLDLWYNPISELPETMVQLRNLRSLDLSGLNFNKEFQQKWTEKLSWVKIEFEAACDCSN